MQVYLFKNNFCWKCNVFYIFRDFGLNEIRVLYRDLFFFFEKKIYNVKFLELYCSEREFKDVLKVSVFNFDNFLISEYVDDREKNYL